MPAKKKSQGWKWWHIVLAILAVVSVLGAVFMVYRSYKAVIDAQKEAEQIAATPGAVPVPPAPGSVVPDPIAQEAFVGSIVEFLTPGQDGVGLAGNLASLTA